MEKGPEQNNKLTKKDIGYVVASGVALLGVLSLHDTLYKKFNDEYIDFLMLYGIPGFYYTIYISMVMYNSFKK